MTELMDSPVVDEIDQDLVCTDVVQVTHDVRSFVLAPAEPRRLDFRAGQYLTLRLDLDGREVERCYTISSPPTRPDRLTVTVKRVPQGPVSNWLHDRLEVGDRLRASGPHGRFTLEEHPAARYLLLTAGVGITPLMSMLRTVRDAGGEQDVHLVHSARTPGDIVFRAELEDLAAQGVRVTTVCQDDGGDPGWAGERGRLTLPMLRRIAPELLEAEILLCGPPGYMDAVRDLLAQAGVDPARCHQESFVLGRPGAPEVPAAVGVPQDAAVGFAVEFRRSGRTVACDAGTTVLDAAARAGLSLPSSCGEGVCGTCKTMVLEGEVDMVHGGGIRPREIARGQALLCCSTPRGDLVVDA